MLKMYSIFIYTPTTEFEQISISNTFPKVMVPPRTQYFLVNIWICLISHFIGFLMHENLLHFHFLITMWVGQVSLSKTFLRKVVALPTIVVAKFANSKCSLSFMMITSIFNLFNFQIPSLLWHFDSV